MTTQPIQEVIFIGLPGPTHNYGGLSADNVASSLNRGSTSNPKQAAHQALALVRLLMGLGVPVGILPPQLRPHMPELRRHFEGVDDDIIRRAAREKPQLLEKMTSSSAMWVANAATVTAPCDSADGRLHLTTANLHTNLHRRIEAEATHRVLSAVFAQVPGAVVHPPLDAAHGLRDEGAANHMRLAPSHGMAALNVYVYGADGSADDPASARQTRSAFEAVVAQHRIAEAQQLLVKQNPAAITAGVFHNDVIAVANGPVLLVHEAAYANGRFDIEHMADRYHGLFGQPLHLLLITHEQLELDEAVHTYFFNSQIVTRPDGSMAIIAPTEVKELYAGKAARLLESLRADATNPVAEVHYADLRQSMNNGGGPACLRLRVPMHEVQLAALKQSVNVLADEALLSAIEKIIDHQYPSQLDAASLADPRLYHTCRAALSQLAGLMKLPLV
jgi:succinylarginine dihydrolase